MIADRGAAVAVVVPANDEGDSIEACLSSIRDATANLARSHAGVRVISVVVADACTDATECRASDAGAIVVRIAARSVGTARRVGTAVALRLLGGRHPDDWIACTDADTTVPTGWLSEGLLSRDAGADFVLGTVRPDFRDLPVGYAAWWHSTHPVGRPNGHVHGANLGIRRSAYAAVGGFGDLAVNEDVDLVHRLRAIGARESHSDRAEVVTSARRSGRAPGGYAAYIAAQLDELGR